MSPLEQEQAHQVRLREEHNIVDPMSLQQQKILEEELEKATDDDSLSGSSDANSYHIISSPPPLEVVPVLQSPARIGFVWRLFIGTFFLTLSQVALMATWDDFMFHGDATRVKISQRLEKSWNFWFNESLVGTVLTNEIMAQKLLSRLDQIVQWETSWKMWNETGSRATRLLFTSSMSNSNTNQQRPGYQLAQQGARAKYPVVMIPGFVTSGLELWQGDECTNLYFRQRMWGALDSARTLLMDKHCWRDHIALDVHSGMDPPNVRVRAAEGFGGADYFIGNYWVWDKLLQNLAVLGYDASNMSIETYDWRLAFPLLEHRDGYLTKLKYKIEALHKSTGEKVVLTSHSMGAMLVHYFMKWVTTSEKQGGGGGGKRWVDEHVHAYVNIAGSHLGVPKATSALLSGEMKDTVMMGPMASMAEQFFGRQLRKDLWTTWGSLWGMLPKGSSRLWDIGADLCLDQTIPSDPFCSHLTEEPTPFFVIDQHESSHFASGSATPTTQIRWDRTKKSSNNSKKKKKLKVPSSLQENTAEWQPWHPHLNKSVEEFASSKNQPATATVDFMLEWGSGYGPSMSSAELYKSDPRMQWLDPTETPLPYAPKMTMYCLYGVGAESDRGFMYRRFEESEGSLTSSSSGGSGSSSGMGIAGASGDGAKTMPKSAWHDETSLPFVLDTDLVDPEHKIKNGIRFSDGDGSVPLLSLGYMCADAWTRKSSGLNPSGAKVITREYQNRPKLMVEDPMRGGPQSADHVDILGNVDMTEDFLRVVTDFHPREESRVVSDIYRIARTINEHPNGGLFQNKKRN